MPKRRMRLTLPASVMVVLLIFPSFKASSFLGGGVVVVVEIIKKIMCDEWLVSVCLYNFKPSHYSLAKHFQRCHTLWLQMN